MSLSLRRICGAAMVGLLGLVLAAPVHADPLSASGLLLPVPQELNPSDGNTVNSIVAGFGANNAFSGELTTLVIENDSRNPYGGLTFIYQILNDGQEGSNSIGRLAIDSFIGIEQTDVSYLVDDDAVAPVYADRGVNGAIVGFSFFTFQGDPHTGFLNPGDMSSELIVHTNARGYQQVVASIIDGSVAQAASFGPVVPEPSSIALLGLGIAAAGLVARRRK
ncbi:MAG: PEP-CTERM sorting domain-containing protein [Planctomycetia bacterium]|nr:PEP-CTERM sorting domain-containing protein [Planctomycetia bacterium]